MKMILICSFICQSEWCIFMNLVLLVTSSVDFSLSYDKTHKLTSFAIQYNSQYHNHTKINKYNSTHNHKQQ
jgi:hypothetical protein